MATYSVRGYSPDDFSSSLSTGSVGSEIQLEPTWDAASDYLQISVKDDDKCFDGDNSANETGNDATQIATISDTSGTTLGSGRVYLEDRYTLDDGAGNIVYVYTVEIDGVVQAVVTDPMIVPGTTYTVTAAANVGASASAPSYYDPEWSTFDQDTGQTYVGGANDDNFSTGGGADTINAGAGSDTVDAGAGNDTIYYGAGGATQADGDTVHGGDGDDVIDDTGGVQLVYDDTLYGDAGNDTIYGGAGDDEIYGGADNDYIYGEIGDDELFGGAGSDHVYGGDGYDIIDGGAGDDTLSGGADEDVFVFQDGSGTDTITDFDMADADANGKTNDQLDVSGLTDADGNPVNAWDATVTEDGSGNAVLTFPNGESITLTGVAPAQVDTAIELHSIGIPCFTSGTRIMTPSGERNVEDLHEGDLVVTVEAGPQPILWHGTRRLGPEALKSNPHLRPILIRDGTFGNQGDLLVSPQHGMVVPDPRSEGGRAFARAIHLLRFGDGRIRRAAGKRHVTYHHLLLPQHATVLANGALSESLYPGRFALSGFDRAAKAELFDLFPAFDAILQEPSNTIAKDLYGPGALSYLSARLLKRQGPSLFARKTTGVMAEGSASTRSLGSNRPCL